MALKKPNIVVYLSDDHGSEYLGCYGNEYIQTPHLDRIAEDGIRFTHAFTPTPTCAPSRSTLYTGLYPARHGAMAIIRSATRTSKLYRVRSENSAIGSQSLARRM